MFNKQSLEEALKNFYNEKPFGHCIVDEFLDEKIAKQVESEFLDYNDPRWYQYKNPLEDKKTLNIWDRFPSLTYQLFRNLISSEFIKIISDNIKVPLYSDPGLHGGGWHIHGQAGNLNPHLDYSIHPQIRLQRKINIIIYVSSPLKEEHGGHLGLWAHDFERNKPSDLIKIIQPKFNRAVIFDTTQNSWHGICKPLVQPEGVFRKSLAVYYLTDPLTNVDQRERALYAAREDQIGNQAIEDLIKKRADPINYSMVYRSKY